MDSFAKLTPEMHKYLTERLKSRLKSDSNLIVTLNLSDEDKNKYWQELLADYSEINKVLSLFEYPERPFDTSDYTYASAKVHAKTVDNSFERYFNPKNGPQRKFIEGKWDDNG